MWFCHVRLGSLNYKDAFALDRFGENTFGVRSGIGDPERLREQKKRTAESRLTQSSKMALWTGKR